MAGALRSVALLLLLAAAWANAAPASAEEFISQFRSAVTIGQDGTLAVREDIRVHAEGRQIRRGIYRDFPLQFEGPDGRLHQVGFTVTSVKRGGRPEPYHIERNRKIARVYIGDANVFLDPGFYEYEIAYTTDRQIRFFDDHDELLWNVTGNGWDFDIQDVRATVTLPPGGKIDDTVSYTGAYGSTANNALAQVSADRNTVEFRSTRPLRPREGMTVGVSFAKGLVPQPTQADELGYWVRENRDLVVLGSGLMLVLAYYLFGWWRVGRDLPAGVIVPRWDAPEGISPALTSYIDRKGLAGGGWGAIAAGILNLAVKGHVRLEDVGDKTTIVLEDGKPPPLSLPVGEAALLKSVRGGGGRLRLAKADGPRVKTMQSSFSAAMEREHRNAFYIRNLGWVVGGIALSVVVLGVTILLGNLAEEEIALVAFLGIASVIATVVIANVARDFSSGLAGKIKAVWTSGFVLVMLFSFGGGLVSSIVEDRLPLLAGGLLALAVLNGLFYVLMGAPTPLGRRMMDGIEGLKTYIRLAESDRMNLKGAPAMSPKHYETLLPYAVALRLEKPWTQAFQTWLVTAAAAGTAAAVGYYGPRWYSGHTFNADDFGRSIGHVTAGLESSLAASIPAPKSSSSGFSGGGGGFSGGGGGGGGGGGW